MKKYWQIKPWMFVVLLLILVGSLLYAFGGGNYGGFPESYENSGSTRSMEMEMAIAPAMDMDGDFGDMDESYDERMIIKTGSLSIVVDDVRKSVEDIVNYAEEKGGFLVTSNVNKSGIDMNGYLTVRVPSEFLDDAIAYIKEMGDVEDERIDGQDITEEYVDLEAKLGNLQATEKQFLEIMKTAVRIEDVLAVQKELSSVRGNIESIEGRMKYLKESVDLSSLTVYLSTDPSTLPVINEEDKWKPFAIFKEALRSLLDTGKGVLNALIWLGVYLPVVIVLLLIVWGIKRYLIRKKK
ncbi:MAG: DUF4349 domain-containing protein [Nitrospirota bacterium]